MWMKYLGTQTNEELEVGKQLFGLRRTRGTRISTIFYRAKKL